MARVSEKDCLKTLEKVGANNFGSVNENNFRCLFDQILLDFEKSSQTTLRPLPPMHGNGESVDLYKLYLAVRDKGGYKTVSENGFWVLVAETLGFSSCVGSALKLIYSKYLGKLDSWSPDIVNEKDIRGVIEDMNFSDVASDVLDPKKEDGESPNPETDNSFVDEVSSRKRKRESHTKMLSWVLNVAKDPCNVEFGSLPEKSKWKNYGEDKLWKQVLVAREMMCVKRNAYSAADQSPTKLAWRLAHPSMYEDLGTTVRSSGRVVPAKELSSKTRAPSESSSGTRSDLEDDFGNTESFPANSVFFYLCDKDERKWVPVGPKFQADVPEMTNLAYESDPKWLGSRVWPLESGERRRHLVERERMGRGRQDSCGCQYQGSVECVRFHVAEKRIRVNLELGSAFSYWKFNKMGEEVALSWTQKEEETFQGVIRSNPPSQGKSFWDEIVKAFPDKKREELVSYYFNVFLLQRRSYQNRSTSSNIDTDNEDSEFGSLSDGSKHNTGKSPSSIFYSPKKAHSSS